MVTRASFYLDTEGYYINAPACILPTDSKYVLGILNSKLISYFLKSICAERQGGFIEQKPIYVSQIPIVECKSKQKEKIEYLVRKIILLNKKLESFGKKQTDEKTHLEKEIKKIDDEIDQEVYELYGLTKREIELIENS